MNHVISLSRHRKLRTQPPYRESIFADLDFHSAYQPILSPTHQKLVGFGAGYPRSAARLTGGIIQPGQLQ